jgi:hypothetical protein
MNHAEISILKSQFFKFVAAADGFLRRLVSD